MGGIMQLPPQLTDDHVPRHKY